MAAATKSAINVVFGAMTIGKPGVEMTRVHTLEKAAEILDIFQAHGYTEVDTARSYGEGSSEEFLGDLDWQARGITMDTKLYPTKGLSMFPEQWTHSPTDIRAGLMASLKALKATKINMFYLHGPDRTVPFEVTLREINALHKEGYFDRFGLSNYMAWEVAQICEICERNGWIRPCTYQGIYSAWQRSIEPELLVCLRHYGMSIFTFNGLAGGFLTNRYHRDDKNFETGSRFDPNRGQGKMHHLRYWDDVHFDALDVLRPVAEKHELTESECALRWVVHHSQLKKELGDVVIVGASSATQLEQNLGSLETGPLPTEVVEALDKGWDMINGTGVSNKYWH